MIFRGHVCDILANGEPPSSLSTRHDEHFSSMKRISTKYKASQGNSVNKDSAEIENHQVIKNNSRYFVLILIFFGTKEKGQESLQENTFSRSRKMRK